MRRLIMLLGIGFAAQLIDGALGMAYGASSATLLLGIGLAPAMVSASVHLAEIGTTLASGTAHWRLGNVDWSVVRRVAVPGAIGAFAGAVLLASLSTAGAKPWTAAILLVLGAVILAKGMQNKFGAPREPRPVSTRMLVPLGLFAGFIDATGGGGWGPIATPTLLMNGRLEPRKVIGSVDTSEFVVALAASAGFLLTLGRQGVLGTVVLALLVGGVVAAPLAAWLVRIVPAAVLGTAVGGLLLISNTRTILSAYEVDAAGRTPIYAVLFAVVAVAVAVSSRRIRRDRLNQRRPERHERYVSDAVETPSAGVHG